MPFCPNCGAGISTPFCPTCGNPTAIEGAAVQDAASSSVAIPGFYRTPFQVLVLDYASFGLYTLYWLVRGRRIAEIRLGVRRTSYWQGLLLIVPIINIFVIVDMMQKIGTRVRTSTRPPAFSLGLQCFAMILVAAMWRLPDPVWLVSMFSSMLLATMHASVAQADRNDNPGYVWPRFTAWEWIITALGAIFLALVAVGMIIPPSAPSSAAFVVAVLIVMAMSLVGFALVSRKYKPLPAGATVEAGSLY